MDSQWRCSRGTNDPALILTLTLTLTLTLIGLVMAYLSGHQRDGQVILPNRRETDPFRPAFGSGES